MTALTKDRSVIHAVGTISRIEMRGYGDEGKEFLRVYMDCPITLPDGSRGTTTLYCPIFPSAKAPNLPREVKARIHEGEMVEVRGWFDIREYVNQQGLTRRNYNVAWARFHQPAADQAPYAEFALLGTISRVRGPRVTITTDNSYVTKDGKEKTQIKTFEVILPDTLYEREETTLEAGAKYEFGGLIAFGYFSKGTGDTSADHHFKAMLGDHRVESKTFKEELHAQYCRYLGEGNSETEEIPF